jgi:hypothetical protein
MVVFSKYLDPIGNEEEKSKNQNENINKITNLNIQKKDNKKNIILTKTKKIATSV